ncbi:MAG: DJ-1/PfpI family protein [Bacillota bacterium]|nr:DJ-1/PfpI family protein [Bacillota bacterium]
MVYLFLADGFEEIEALAVVDILRRGGVEIKTVSITNEKIVTGSHGISVIADITFKSMSAGAECIILPGGMPGATNLGKSEIVEKTIGETYKNGGIIAAICAAPSIFYDYGLLKGKRATSFPSYKKDMTDCIYTESAVEEDGCIITSRGAGTAHLFGFKLLSILTNEENSNKISESMQYGA